MKQPDRHQAQSRAIGDEEQIGDDRSYPQCDHAAARESGDGRCRRHGSRRCRWRWFEGQAWSPRPIHDGFGGSRGEPLENDQNDDARTAHGVEAVEKGQRHVSKLDPGIECRRAIGADPDQPAGYGNGRRPVLITGHGENLRTVGGETQGVEDTVGKRQGSMMKSMAPSSYRLPAAELARTGRSVSSEDRRSGSGACSRLKT